MALGAQNQQISLTMVLEAQNKASAAIKEVSNDLQKLGKGVSLTGLSEGIQTSIQQVTASIKEGTRQQEENARTSARTQLDNLRSSLREREQAIKQSFAAETRDYEMWAQDQLQTQRSTAAKSIQQERMMRDEMLHDARTYFEKITQQARAAAESEANVWREAEREQIAAARTRMQDRLAAGVSPTMARTDAATEIRDARRQRQAMMAELKAQSSEESVLLQANKDAALAIAHSLYQERIVVVEKGLSAELERIKALTGGATAQFNHAAQDAIAAARREAEGMEQAIATGLNRALANIQAKTQEQVAAERTAGERILAESQRIAQEQARIAKAGGPIGVVLEGAQGHLKRFSGAVGDMVGAVNKSLGPLEKFIAFARMMVIWQVGYTALSAVLEGLGKMVTGLVSTNMSFEQTTKTFEAFYGNAAPKVVQWLDAFAEHTPATREEVRQAGLTVASLGDSIGQVMPSLENLASVMGKDLPTAAQAFSDAQQGRFEMMQISMRTSKPALEAYGLQVDSVGHIMNNSFVPAFERYVAARFGEHIAYDAQQVTKANQALAGAGAVPKQVMPALEYGASLMGVKNLSDASGAYTQAMAGNLAPLENMFHLTTAELVKQGLVIGANGQIVSGTLAPAFAKVIALDFGGHIGKATTQTSAMQKQMETLGGALSNVQDAFQFLQRTMGQGIFSVLEKQALRLVDMLNSPLLASWAHRTGEDIGHMAQQAISWFNHLWVRIGQGPGVLRMLGRALQEARSVLNGLGDSFHYVWNVVSFVVGVIRTAIGVFTSVTGAGRGTVDMTRTMVAVLGDAYITWKLLTAGLGFAEGALKLWNMTAGKAITALRTQKTVTEGQTLAQTGQTTATKLGAEAETVMATQTTVAKDAQVTATVVSGELKTATGALTIATGTLTTAETGAALTTGELATAQVVATTRTGLFGGALALLSGGLAGLKGVLLATLGPIGIWVAAIGLSVVAVKQLADAWDVLENKMDPATRKDIASALTPTGTAGHPIYKMHGTRLVQEGSTGGTGDIGAFGASLNQGAKPGQQTDAYWAYARMISTGNPDYWIAYLRKHTDVEKRYLAMMDREGRGDVARQILAGTSSLLPKGDTATALDPTGMLKQQYQKSLQTFQWALRHDPGSALADLQDVQAQQIALLEAQGKSVDDALTMGQNQYNQLLKSIPAKYRTEQGYTGAAPGAPPGSTTGPTGETPKEFAKDLARFRATTWVKALDAVRAGSISDVDLQNLVQQYETLETQAGQPVTDTKIQNQIKAALKTRVAGMIRKFNADLTKALAGTLPGGQRALEAEIGQIETVEAQAGMTDYTDYEGRVTTAFAKKAKTAAQAQMTPLVHKFNLLFDRLRHHVRGVTAQMVEQIITQIQGIEIGAGLSTDDTAMMSQRVQDWLGAQQQASGKTKATSTYQQYKGEYDQAIARFHAEARKEPDVARSMIPGIQEDVVQMAYARTKNWSFAIAEGKAAVTKLNAEIDRATGGIKGLSNAEYKYKDDLATLGQSAADRKRLMDDANRVYQLEIHGGMNRNKAHAEYEQHLKQINAHMKATGTLPGIAQPYHAYGGLAASAGYGSVTASFGVPSTATSILLAQLAESRRQTHYWQQQDAHDKQVIASLQAQLVVGRESVGMLRDIRGGILSAATPTSQRSLQSHIRNSGVIVPITNP